MHAQTVLTEEDVEALKQKTGDQTTKGSIAKAVEHFLNCKHSNETGEDVWVKKINAAIEKRLEKEKKP